MGASPCAAVLGLGSIPTIRLLHLPGYLGPLTTPPRVCFITPALNRSQDLSLCADGTARRGQSPLRCWGSEPPVPSAARLPRPAAPPEAAGKRRDSLTVHESVFRKRGGKKAGEIKAQSKGNSLMRRAAGERGSRSSAQAAPLFPSLPWLVFPPAEAGAGTGPTSRLRGGQNLGEGHLCSRGEPGAPRTPWKLPAERRHRALPVPVPRPPAAPAWLSTSPSGSVPLPARGAAPRAGGFSSAAWEQRRTSP